MGDTMTTMDPMPYLNAVLGTSGVAGLIVALQNWFGVPRAVRRIESLITLRQHLLEVDGRDVEAVSLALRVESFRLTARTVERRSVISVLSLIVLFVVFFLLSPLLTPPARSDPAWLAGVRGTVDGLAALGGGYAALELMVRLTRARLVRDWLAGRPIQPHGDKAISPALKLD